MREPYEIASGWYFEGNMSLDDKHAIIKDDLPRLGIISAAFVSCAQDFVAGKSVKKYEPDADETRRLFQKWLDDEKYGPNADDPILSQIQKWLDAKTARSA